MSSLKQREGPLCPGVAFVTGGARGLGNAVAVSFAKEGARAVVIVDILDDEALAAGKKEVDAYGTKCITIRADVSNEAEVESAVAQTVEAFGRIDYCANFAGITGPFTLITDTSLDQFQKCQNVNANGVFLCTKHQLKQMLKQDSLPVEDGRINQKGCIINCASVNSLQSAQAVSAYTASKHAVHGITKTAALEARGHGIRVNAVSPGFLLTPMSKAGLAVNGEMANAMWDACISRQGRVAKFEEIGDAVTLLCTPRASLVNGQNLMLDNGFTINESAF